MLKRGLVIGLLAANVLMSGCGQKAEEGTKEGATDVQTEQTVDNEAPPAEEPTAGDAESNTTTQEEEQKPAEEKKPEKKSSKKKKSKSK